MRLINADELKERIAIDSDLVEMCDGSMVPCIDFEYNIDFAPTVDAIPIEWLDMFMQRYKIQGDDEYKLLHFMVTEWKKWEKENEAN